MASPDVTSQGEVWRGRGAKAYGKYNVFARPLWDPVCCSFTAAFTQVSTRLHPGEVPEQAEP